MLREHICERLDWLRTTNATALDCRARFFLLCRSVIRFDGYIGSCRLHGASILFRVCSPLAALALSSIIGWDQFMVPVVRIENDHIASLVFVWMEAVELGRLSRLGFNTNRN